MRKFLQFTLSLVTMLMFAVNANAWKFTLTSPAEGNVSSIYEVVLHYEGAIMLDEWSQMNCDVTDASNNVVSSIGFVDGMNGRVSGVPTDYQEIKSDGTYTLTIPANTFHIDGVGNEKSTFTWTIGTGGGGGQGEDLPYTLTYDKDTEFLKLTKNGCTSYDVTYSGGATLDGYNGFFSFNPQDPEGTFSNTCIGAWIALTDGEYTLKVQAGTYKFDGVENEAFEIKFTVGEGGGGGGGSGNTEFDGEKWQEVLFKAGETTVSTPVAFETEGLSMTTEGREFTLGSDVMTIDVGYNTNGEKEINWRNGTKLIFTAKDNISGIVMEGEFLQFASSDKGTYNNGVWTGSLMKGETLTLTANDGINIKKIVVLYNGKELEEEENTEIEGVITVAWPVANQAIASIAQGGKLCEFTTNKDYAQVTIQLKNNNTLYTSKDLQIRMYDGQTIGEGVAKDITHTVTTAVPNESRFDLFKGDSYTMVVKGFVNMYDVQTDNYDAIVEIPIVGNGIEHEPLSSVTLVSITPAGTPMNPGQLSVTDGKVTVEFSGAVTSVKGVNARGMEGSTTYNATKVDADGKIWQFTFGDLTGLASGETESAIFNLDITAKAADGTVVFDETKDDYRLEAAWTLVAGAPEPVISLGTPVFSITEGAEISVDDAITVSFPNAENVEEGCTYKIYAAIYGQDFSMINANGEGASPVTLSLASSLVAGNNYNLAINQVDIMKGEELVKSFQELPYNVNFTTTEAQSNVIDIAVERTVGLGYQNQVVEFDGAAVLQLLGASAWDNSIAVYPVNPTTGEQATDDSDGWRDPNGVPAAWNTGNGVCLKYPKLADGVYSMDLCTFPGLDNTVGTVYPAQWAVNYNGKAVILNVTVTLVEAPAVTFNKVKTVDVPVYITPATAYELGNTATFDLNEAMTALGVSDPAAITAYIYQPDGTFVANTTDGWRNAEGFAAGWNTSASQVCAKVNVADANFYDIMAIDNTYAEGATYTAMWALAAGENAVVYNVNITFGSAPEPKPEPELVIALDVVNPEMSESEIWNIYENEDYKVYFDITKNLPLDPNRTYTLEDMDAIYSYIYSKNEVLTNEMNTKSWKKYALNSASVKMNADATMEAIVEAQNGEDVIYAKFIYTAPEVISVTLNGSAEYVADMEVYAISAKNKGSEVKEDYSVQLGIKASAFEAGTVGFNDLTANGNKVKIAAGSDDKITAANLTVTNNGDETMTIAGTVVAGAKTYAVELTTNVPTKEAKKETIELADALEVSEDEGDIKLVAQNDDYKFVGYITVDPVTTDVPAGTYDLLSYTKFGANSDFGYMLDGVDDAKVVVTNENGTIGITATFKQNGTEYTVTSNTASNVPTPEIATITITKGEKNITITSSNETYALQTKFAAMSSLEEGETPESVVLSVLDDMDGAFSSAEEFNDYYVQYATKGEKEIDIEGMEELYPGEMFFIAACNIAWSEKEGKPVLASNVAVDYYTVPTPEPVIELAVSLIANDEEETEYALNTHSMVTVDKEIKGIKVAGLDQILEPVTYAIYSKTETMSEGVLSVNTIGYMEFAAPISFAEGVQYNVVIKAGEETIFDQNFVGAAIPEIAVQFWNDATLLEDGAELDPAETKSINVTVALPDGVDPEDDLYIEGTLFGKDGTNQPIIGFTDFETGADVDVSRLTAGEGYTIIITKVAYGEVIGYDEETFMPIYETTIEDEQGVASLFFSIKAGVPEPEGDIAVSGTEENVKIEFPWEDVSPSWNEAILLNGKPVELEFDSDFSVTNVLWINTANLADGDYTLVFPAGSLVINGVNNDKEYSISFVVNNGIVGIGAIAGDAVKANGKYLENGQVVIYRNGIKYSVSGATIK